MTSWISSKGTMIKLSRCHMTWRKRSGNELSGCTQQSRFHSDKTLHSHRTPTWVKNRKACHRTPTSVKSRKASVKRSQNHPTLLNTTLLYECFITIKRRLSPFRLDPSCSYFLIKDTCVRVFRAVIFFTRAMQISEVYDTHNQMPFWFTLVDQPPFWFTIVDHARAFHDLNIIQTHSATLIVFHRAFNKPRRNWTLLNDVEYTLFQNGREYITLLSHC